MEVIVSCMECQAQNGIPNFSSLAAMRMPDDGVIDAICPAGHRTFTIVQQAKFEILSYLAVKGVLDGYYRDAIASFTASLERLYEYFIKAANAKVGVDRERTDEVWNLISAQSERQLGAFYFTYLMVTGAAPAVMPTSKIRLRNAVVHKGRLPTREEAVAYGQAVADCARPVIELLRSPAYENVVQMLTHESLAERQGRAAQAGVRSSTCCIPTPFSLTWSEPEYDIASVISSYAKHPDATEIARATNAVGAAIALAAQVQNP